jgi:hypothetical protein
MADLFWRSQKKPGRSASDTKAAPERFNKFQNQTADAWDAADDELIKGQG